MRVTDEGISAKVWLDNEGTIELNWFLRMFYHDKANDQYYYFIHGPNTIRRVYVNKQQVFFTFDRNRR